MRKLPPIEIYVADSEDRETVEYAKRVVEMLRWYGYEVGALYVADDDS